MWVRLDERTEPLVIITTNEERDLPRAFLRRCVVLSLRLPEDDTALKDLIVKRGEQHGALFEAPPTQQVLETCADLLVADRKQYRSQGRPVPGQAEYLDLLQAVCRLASKEDERLQLLEQLRPFVLKKHDRLFPDAQ